MNAKSNNKIKRSVFHYNPVYEKEGDKIVNTELLDFHFFSRQQQLDLSFFCIE